MYESPIAICMKQIRMTQDETIVRAVQDVGIFVDKGELIKALQYDREQYEKGFADGLEAAQKQQWIPVTERMPKEQENVLCTDGIHVEVGELIEGSFYDLDTYDSSIISGVTHWMPLPDPPKVE